MRFDHIADLNPTVTIKKGEVAPFVEMAALPEHARDMRKIGERPFKGSGSRFQDGDTLIARITPCLENGKGALVSGLGSGTKAFGSTEFIVARAKNPSDQKFVYYITRYEAFRETAIARMEGTSGRQRVAWQQIASIEIPELASITRHEIGELLGALDDKIDLNHKTAATLEAMARALYRAWFVDFDPVHAKSQGHTPAHMDTTAAALFPASFTEDGLPEGWEVEPISRHVSVSRGLSYKGAGLCGEADGVPLHNLNSVFEGGGYKTAGIKYYNGDFKPRHEIAPGDLIVTNTEQGFDLLLMGHAALVPHYFGPTGLFSQHIYKVDPKPGSPLSRAWLYLMLSVSPKGQEIRSYANGTTVNMLPMDALEIPEVCFPPHELIHAFDGIVEPMFARKESIELENQTLAQLRDTLLPRLMSGDLRVAAAREQVEDVA